VKAIMLAAGEGTRCYPFTHLSPKLFQQIGGIPLIEYMLSWFGGTPEIEKLYIAVRNDSIISTLENYLSKRSGCLDEILKLFRKLGYTVEYNNRDFSIEVVKADGWGTGGDLRKVIDIIRAEGGLGEDFLLSYADYVITRTLPNGETSLQLDLSDIIEYHKDSRKVQGTVMTVAVVPVEKEEATRFGVAMMEQNGDFRIVRGFMEKPDIREIKEERPAVNAGVCLIDSSYLLARLDDYLPRRPDISLERDMMEKMAREERPRLAAYLLHLDEWYDVGTLEQLINVNIKIVSRKGGGK
jgi:NDP-sugar pyrophosphorylase family protein